MPKVYSRDCDHCGNHYEGYGAKYCSQECSNEAAREKASTPEQGEHIEEERIEQEDRGDLRVLKVWSPDTIRSPEEAFERSGLDPDVWEYFDATTSTWPTSMKVDGYPVQVQNWYHRLNLRKKADAAFDLKPYVLSVTRPAKRQQTTGDYVSVHYSDLHIPFHDPSAVNVLYQVIDYLGPDRTVDHGDTADCWSISDYEKDPHDRIPLNDEIRMVARHHGTIHALTPDADHDWFKGNHEDRLRGKIWEMAESRAGGEILTLPSVSDTLEWQTLTGVDDLEWRTVDYPEHRVLFGKLILKHGNSIRKHSAYSARAEYDKYKKSGMSGHTHRQGVYETRDHNGRHAWFELGMLGQIRNDYVDFPDWQQGFAVVTWSSNRERFGVEAVRIHEGVAYFRGQRFVGDSTLFGGAAEQAA